MRRSEANVAPFPLAGELCALLAAMVWAVALVLFRTSGLSVPPISLNLFKNTIGLLLLAVTLLVRREPFGLPLDVALADIGVLGVSGILGIAVADTLFFYALNRVGVGILSVVDCSYTPFVIVCSWLLLGERLEPHHYVGVVLILGGVLLASGHAPPPGSARAQLLPGILAGAGAMASMALAIVYAKPVLERTSVYWATFVRLLIGHAALVLFALIRGRPRETFRIFRPGPAWRSALPGAVLGTYVSLLLWVAGFKYASASVAAVLNQTSVIFAILLAALLLREPLTRRKIAAAALAFGGVLLVTMYPWLRE